MKYLVARERRSSSRAWLIRLEGLGPALQDPAILSRPLSDKLMIHCAEVGKRRTSLLMVARLD